MLCEGFFWIQDFCVLVSKGTAFQPSANLRTCSSRFLRTARTAGRSLSKANRVSEPLASERRAPACPEIWGPRRTRSLRWNLPAHMNAKERHARTRTAQAVRELVVPLHCPAIVAGLGLRG